MSKTSKLATQELLNSLMGKMREEIGASLAAAFEDGRRSGLKENQETLVLDMLDENRGQFLEWLARAPVSNRLISEKISSARDQQGLTLREGILEALRDSPRGLSQKEIVDELQNNPRIGPFNPDSVKVTLYRLKNDKLIVMGNDSRWLKV